MKKRLTERIITRFGRYFLARNAALNKIDREFIPFSHAKKIGIVYNALNKEEADLVLKFAALLENKGKVVNTLGYLNRKQLDGEFTPNYRNDFFCNKDLTAMRLPKEMSVKRFISEPFDYLMNLYVQDDFALIGISALSKAKFRIGQYRKEYIECFDLMLKPKEDGLKDLLDEIKYYVKIND